MTRLGRPRSARCRAVLTVTGYGAEAAAERRGHLAEAEQEKSNAHSQPALTWQEQGSPQTWFI